MSFAVTSSKLGIPEGPYFTSIGSVTLRVMALDETRHNLIFNTSREHYGSFVSPVAFSYDIPSLSVASLVLLCNLHIFITLYFFEALLEYVRTVGLQRRFKNDQPFVYTKFILYGMCY